MRRNPLASILSAILHFNQHGETIICFDFLFGGWKYYHKKMETARCHLLNTTDVYLFYNCQKNPCSKMNLMFG